MNKRKMRRFISDYLDGESKNAEYVERLISTDPEANRYHLQLLELKKSIQSLKAPEVSADFSSRVLARIAQADTERAGPRWLWVGLPAAAVALLVILSVTYVLQLNHNTLEPSHTQFSAVETLDVDAITELIETRIAQGESLPLNQIELAEAEDTFTLDSSYENTDTSDVLEGLLAAIESESDLSIVLESLQNGEATAFRNLLAEYVLEG